VKRLAARLSREDGIALILAIVIMIVLVAVSTVLITSLVSENSRSTHSVVRQQSYQAAEAGVNSYASKLLEDGLFYTHYVAPGESTRRNPATGTLTTAGSQWTGGLSWTYPNGHDWVATPQLQNNYEYNLQITPPSSTACADSTDPLCGAITITSTGRPHGDTNTADWRELQVLVRPSSVSDYYRIVDGSIGFGDDTITNGKVYANGDIDHDGTASANLYAEGQITGPPSYTNNAKGYDIDSSPNIRSQIPVKLDFNSFLASVSTIAAIAQKAGTHTPNTNGQYFDTTSSTGVVTGQAGTYKAWVLTFNTNGTFDAKACKPSSGTDPAGGNSPMTSCSSSANWPVPTNGAIYSPEPVVVQGTVVGRVTIASKDDIVVGGPLAPKTSGTDVLGLVATNDVVIAKYVPSTLTWSAAVCAVGGTWKTDTSDDSKDTMTFTGSSATADGGDMTMFDKRVYSYDANLLKLPPPWFPQLQAYTTVLFREISPS
jgi:hypothetical protein